MTTKLQKGSEEQGTLPGESFDNRANNERFTASLLEDQVRREA
ncbi:hypothetical protein [Oceanospirillum sanctuarii]|nr:hypothetical protein [Oceanospirillum sanctuarii]